MLDKVISGGEVVTESGVVEANIGIKGESIAAIFDPSVPVEARETINAKGKIVIPGVIDTHTHFNMFQLWSFVNDFGSTALTAAYGGVTTLLIHVWGTEGLSIPDTLGPVKEDGEANSALDFSFHCGLWPKKEHISQVPEAVQMGVTSFKMIMGYRSSGRTGRTQDDYTMTEAMDTIAQNKGLALVHAENGCIIDYLEERYAKEGKIAPQYFYKARPNITEAEAIHRAAVIAGLTNCPLYVVHLSTREGLEEVIQANLEGKKVYAETCSQYLVLTDEELTKQGSRAKIAPPLRADSDRDAMWQGIQQGFIQAIGSDHAELKLETRRQADKEGIFKALFGMPGIETMLPLVYSEGVVKGRISLVTMVKAMCENPAKIFGLYPRKGTTKVGSDADLVLLDPNVEWTIKASEQHTKNDYTCYEGMSVKGKPVLSLLRGQLLLKDDTLHVKPGYGKFLPRRPGSYL